MSQALTHFAVGATVTVLVLTFLVPGAPYPRSLPLLGGGLAMLPDVHWVAPVYAAELKSLHGSPLVDLFFLHHTLDATDVGDSHAVAAVALGAFLLATAVAERREYRALRVVREALDGRK